MRRAPVILLEFNELCPGLMERFIRERKLPSFERFFRESRVYTTAADENAPNLEPWIQWITVHSGIPYREHGIFHLDDGHALREKRVWDLLSDSGAKVWVCGSMNAGYHLPLRGWVLPDPWTTKVSPHPADELRPYLRFVAANVLEYTREQVPLNASEKLRFVRFMATHGISAATVRAIVAQLVSERLASAPTRWKRAVILDRLQFDLFRWFYRRERPDFSTFFLNSTAHFQHLYWRNMEPERFTLQPTPEEQAAYEHAVQYGYQQMDDLLRRFMMLAGGEATLIFCTALSQQPFLAHDADGGKMWYRPRAFEQFLRDAGVASPARAAPVMAHEFQIDFDDEPTAADAEARLTALRVGDRQLMVVTRSDSRIFAACRIFDEVAPDATVTMSAAAGSIPFFDLFYRVGGLKSGMHHPDGMLWIRTPSRQHAVASGKVPLVSIAPTLLEMFGVAKPAYMSGDPIMRGFERAA